MIVMTSSNIFSCHFVYFVTRISRAKFHLDYSSSPEIIWVGLWPHMFKSSYDERLSHAVMTPSFVIKILAKDIKLHIRSLCQFLLFFLSLVIENINNMLFLSPRTEDVNKNANMFTLSLQTHIISWRHLINVSSSLEDYTKYFSGSILYKKCH